LKISFEEEVKGQTQYNVSPFLLSLAWIAMVLQGLTLYFDAEIIFVEGHYCSNKSMSGLR